MFYWFYLNLLSILAVSLLIISARFVLNWIAQRKASQYRSGLFRFSDGVHVRAVDPIAILIALEAHKSFRFDLHPLRAQEGEPEALEIVADAVRQAFDVPAYSRPKHPGLTIRECYDLFRAFIFYADAQKKNIKPTPISAESTGPMSNGSDAPITNDSLVSGSIAPGAVLNSL